MQCREPETSHREFVNIVLIEFIARRQGTGARRQETYIWSGFQKVHELRGPECRGPSGPRLGRRLEFHELPTKGLRRSIGELTGPCDEQVGDRAENTENRECECEAPHRGSTKYELFYYRCCFSQ